MINDILKYYATSINNYCINKRFFGIVVFSTILISFLFLKLFNYNATRDISYCYTKPITDSTIIKTAFVMEIMAIRKYNTIFKNKYANKYKNEDIRSSKFNDAFLVNCLTPQELNEEYYNGKKIFVFNNEVLVFESYVFDNGNKFE